MKMVCVQLNEIDVREIRLSEGRIYMLVFTGKRSPFPLFPGIETSIAHTDGTDLLLWEDAQIYEVEKYVEINHKTVIEWYANPRFECSRCLKEDKMSQGIMKTASLKSTKVSLGERETLRKHAHAIYSNISRL